MSLYILMYNMEAFSCKNTVISRKSAKLIHFTAGLKGGLKVTKMWLKGIGLKVY